MKIVIDLEEEVYKYICNHCNSDDICIRAVKNGLVLKSNTLDLASLDDIATAIRHKESEDAIYETKCLSCVNCDHFGVGCSRCDKNTDE